MSKKVLIRKQAGGVQQFQEIGGRRGPSFMGLARRLKDPTASGWQKVLAGAGMAGKVAAGIGAANQTLHQMHGGNAFAPLNLGYTYQGLDPTSGMERDATLGEQQDSIARNDVRQRSNQTLSNLHQQGYNVRDLASGARTYIPPPAGLPAQTPDSTTDPNRNAQLRGPPGSAQRAWRDRGGFGFAPPGWTPPAAPAAPAAPAPLPPPAGLPAPPVPPTDPMQQTLPIEQSAASGQPVSHELIEATQGSVQPMYEEQPTSTANPLQQATLAPYQGTINPATGQPYPVLRSFAMQVLDEFGDMLQKADPHVAGLLAFRVYMDKIMR
jgi:hypothetical protein